MLNSYLLLQLEETESNKNRLHQQCTSLENELSTIKNEYKILVETQELLKIKIDVSIFLYYKNIINSLKNS